MGANETSKKRSGLIVGAAITAAAAGAVVGPGQEVGQLKNDLINLSEIDLSQVKVIDLSSIEKAFDQGRLAQNIQVGYKTNRLPFGDDFAQASSSSVTACCCCCPCCTC